MAQNTTAKKSNFLSEVVANATALKAARDQLRELAEEFTKDSTIASIADADCVGDNSHLTAFIVNSYLTTFQPGLELILAGTQCTPGSPYLPQIMAVIPG
jgi:hypothetical protein